MRLHRADPDDPALRFFGQQKIFPMQTQRIETFFTYDRADGALISCGSRAEDDPGGGGLDMGRIILRAGINPRGVDRGDRLGSCSAAVRAGMNPARYYTMPLRGNDNPHESAREAGFV
jgi:hypothetical protein